MDYCSGRWAQCYSETVLAAAMECARGRYQRALLTGYEALSGLTLRGKASSYGARYAESRANLLARLHRAGIPTHEVRGAHGARILVIGDPS